MKSFSLSQPNAIVLVGIPGSGKSFFAEKFAETFRTPLVSINRISKHAIDSGHAKELGYLQLQEVMKTKQSIVIDGLSDSRTERDTLIKGLRQFGYTTVFVWVQVDENIARNRYMKLNKASDRDYDLALRPFSPPHEKEKALVISGRHTFATQVRAVLKKIATPRPGSHIRHSTPTRQGSISVRSTKK